MRRAFALLFCVEFALSRQKEPSERDYYSHGNSKDKPWDILRVSNISKAEFARHVSRGIPILIEDALSKSNMAELENMDCNQFASTFNSAHMRQEYTGTNPNDINTQSIGDTSWTEKVIFYHTHRMYC